IGRSWCPPGDFRYGLLAGGRPYFSAAAGAAVASSSAYWCSSALAAPSRYLWAMDCDIGSGKKMSSSIGAGD
ncbi:MAG: hypothetical protein J2P17_17790, partial [Mycobacterium sp.]|nr:hypothetical protein [Mycobacterium sp.]